MPTDITTAINSYLKTLYTADPRDVTTLIVRYLAGGDATKRFLALIAAATGGSAPVAAGYDIILATGDSNKLTGASFDSGLDTADSDIFQLGYTAPNANAVIAANDPLDYATEGVSAGKIGHDMHFAKDYYKANGLLLSPRKILIVPNAKGGSYASPVDGVGSWGANGGSAGAPTAGVNNLTTVAANRLATALALPDTNTVVAVLDLEGSNSYSANGNTLVDGPMCQYRWCIQRKYQFLRNLVGPTVPIVISRPTKDAINAAGGVYSTNGVICDRIIKSLARRFPYVGIADSQSPTELGGDGVSGDVHFDAPEQRILAGRYYTAFLAAKANTGRGVVTWEPEDVRLTSLGAAAGFTLSNGNLDLSGDANSAWKTHCISAPVRSGKVYVEVKIQAMASGTNLGYLGLCNSDIAWNNYLTAAINAQNGPSPKSAGQWGGLGANETKGWTKDWTGNASWTTNDIIQFAVDMSSGKAWIGKNGTWYNSGNPAAGTGQWVSGIADPVYLAASIYTGVGNTYRLQPSAASFSYSPPSGFEAWGA